MSRPNLGLSSSQISHLLASLDEEYFWVKYRELNLWVCRTTHDQEWVLRSEMLYGREKYEKEDFRKEELRKGIVDNI